MDKSKIISEAKEKYIYFEYYFNECSKDLKKIYIKQFLETFDKLEAGYRNLITCNIEDEIINDYRHLYQYVRGIFNQKVITKKIVEFYDGKQNKK